MNILYAFDDKFAEIAGISILSLFENNKDADEINVYAICDGVSDINKQRLITLSEDYGRILIFLDAPDVEKIAGTSLRVTLWSLATFYRIFISSVLPSDMKKIIYIDSDTTVQSSLFELWNTEQGDNIISGVMDIKLPHLRNQRVFLKRKDIYINAGVMLINLALWRHYDVESKFIKFIRLMDGKLPFVDQDVINSVLKGFIGTVDPKFNYLHMIKNKNAAHPKDRVRVREIVRHNNPVIRHYIGIGQRIDKAESGFDIPIISSFRDDWYKWKEMSPWRGLPLDYLRASPRQIPKPIKTKHKALRSRILRFTEKNCKPLYGLLNKLGSYRKAFLRFFAEYLHIRKYNKHRQKITGINIKDCRIAPRERKL
ncbi:MAG: glycosyltransferase family 8 protein [Oscillospiraceae bacterium]|nr:glycosyltransferase family 8 protein [Oscillospiraceae bacterium]